MAEMIFEMINLLSDELLLNWILSQKGQKLEL